MIPVACPPGARDKRPRTLAPIRAPVLGEGKNAGSSFGANTGQWLRPARYRRWQARQVPPATPPVSELVTRGLGQPPALREPVFQRATVPMERQSLPDITGKECAKEKRARPPTMCRPRVQTTPSRDARCLKERLAPAARRLPLIYGRRARAGHGAQCSNINTRHLSHRPLSDTTTSRPPLSPAPMPAG